MAAALIDVDASFERGRLSVIAGASGSGKSTLLRVLAGLQRATTGSVEVAGVELTRMGGARRRRLRRRTMGVVLQDPADNLVEYLRAVEQIELAAQLRGVDRREAGELLEAIGLAHLAGSVPAELSGGEQQRIAFAAAAVGRPSVLLADEPTAELDAAAGTALDRDDARAGRARRLADRHVPRRGRHRRGRPAPDARRRSGRDVSVIELDAVEKGYRPRRAGAAWSSPAST